MSYEQKIDWKSKKYINARKSELEHLTKKGSTTQPATAERRRSGGKFRTISASGTRAVGDPNKSDVISALSTLILKRAAHNNPTQRNRHHY